jgi:hypothetical protein
MVSVSSAGAGACVDVAAEVAVASLWRRERGACGDGGRAGRRFEAVPDGGDVFFRGGRPPLHGVIGLSRRLYEGREVESAEATDCASSTTSTALAANAQTLRRAGSAASTPKIAAPPQTIAATYQRMPASP